MDIVTTHPPNIESILSTFGDVVLRKGVVFTYGQFLHNPSNLQLPVWILEHEQVHSDRQLVHGPEYWWEQYLKDSNFRYEEELRAHQVEYQVWCEVARSRNERRLGLKTMAKRLSSDIYGNCVDFETAKWNIKNG